MLLSNTAKLLRELIALPSVNPALLPGNSSLTGEKRVADFLAATAGKAGFDIDFQDVSADRSNLLIRCQPKGKVRQRIFLAPHMDTVGGAEASLFSPRLVDGRLYGRGACDTKGSIAVMLTALMELTPRSHTEITLAALVDEEYLQAGSRALAASRPQANLAIVGEPTKLKVVTAHKGAVWLTLQTRGKAAHGARPELGRNAVYDMANIVRLIQTQYARKYLRKRHALLGPGTINVGAIRGGNQPNIVPDECTCLIDRRTLPGETDSSVIRELKTLLATNHLNANITKIQKVPCPPLHNSPDVPLVRAFLAAAHQSAPHSVDFFSDAAVLSRGGIPSVLFGPGDIAQAHKPDEWVELDQLDRAKAILLRFLQSLP